MPVLIAIGFFAFSDKLSSAISGDLAFYVALVVTGLFAFSIAGDAVASEFRRGTIDLVRRQPKGMLMAWLGKLTALALAFVVLTIITQGALSFIWGLFADDKHAALRANAVWTTLIDGSSRAWLSVWIVLPVVSWTMMVGTWISKSGAAPIAALVLLGAVLVPLYLWFHANPWMISFSPMEGMRWLSIGVTCIGLLCASIAWIIGRSYRARPWRSVVMSGLLLLGLLGSTAAFGAVKQLQWLDIQSTDPEFRIYAAIIAANESSLWVSVYKGERPYIARKPIPGHGDQDRHWGTPLQTWRVDLSSRRYESVGDGMQFLEDFQHGFTPGHGPLRSLTPTHGVALRDMRDPKSHEFIWLDACSGNVVSRLKSNLRDGAVDRLQQKTLRHASWLRDAQGRRIWVRDRQIEREGEEREPATRVYAVDGSRNYKSLSQIAVHGIVKATQKKGRTWRGFTRGLWLPDGTHVIPKNQESIRLPNWVLNERQSLADYFTKNDKGLHRAERLRTLKLIEFNDEMASQYVELPPRSASRLRSPWAIVGKNQVLTVSGNEVGAGRDDLVIWNPIAGSVTPLSWTGAPYEGTCDTFHVVGRDSGSRFVVAVNANRRPNRSISGETLVLLDLTERTLRTLTPTTHNRSLPIALLKDGSVVTIEGGKRIVKFGPTLGEREQLFPFLD